MLKFHIFILYIIGSPLMGSEFSSVPNQAPVVKEFIPTTSSESRKELYNANISLDFAALMNNNKHGWNAAKNRANSKKNLISKHPKKYFCKV